MITRCMDAYISVVAICVLTVVPGCTACQHPQLHHEIAAIVGTVRTGGQFAVEGVLPVPNSGLTLADATDACLRSAVRNQASGASRVQSTPSLSLNYIPIIQKDTDEVIDRFIANVTSDKSNLNVQSRLAAQKLAGGDEKLFEEIRELLNHTTPENLSGDSNKSARDKLALEIDTLRRKLGVLKATPPQTPIADEVVAVSSPGIYYEAAVLLTRRTGRRIIAPLWMVEMTSVGEIWLNDGDRVEINHYARTEVGAREALGASKVKDGNVVLTGFVSKEALAAKSLPNMMSVAQIDAHTPHNPVCDVVILQHVNEESHLEEYLFPRTTSGAFGDNPALGYWGEHTRLSAGDVVQLDSLDLFSPIIEGRARTLAVNQRTIRQLEMNKCERLHQKKVEQKQTFTNKLRRLPVIGFAAGAAGQTGINSQTIEKSLDRTHDRMSASPVGIELPRLAN